MASWSASRKVGGRPWKVTEGQWKAMESHERSWKVSGRPWKVMEGQWKAMESHGRSVEGSMAHSRASWSASAAEAMRRVVPAASRGNMPAYAVEGQWKVGGRSVEVRWKAVEGRWKVGGRSAEGQWKVGGRSVEGRWKVSGRPAEGRGRFGLARKACRCRRRCRDRASRRTTRAAAPARVRRQTHSEALRSTRKQSEAI